MPLELAHEHQSPSSADGVTFVGCNALTSEIGMWEAQLGERIRAAGHGTLWWNYRGQSGSEAPAGMRLDDAQHCTDTLDVLGAIEPSRPVLIGLSIGGLFATQALLESRDDTPAIAGLVLLNTLRKPGPRLDWINEAVFQAACFGGTALMADLLSPMLFHADWLAANRGNALKGEYAPLDPAVGPCRMLGDARSSNWDVPWERVDVPVLVATGLQDRVFRIDEDIAELSARLPRATTITFERAGHMLPVEAPDALAKAMLEWATTL